MNQRLIILSDLWGIKNADWIYKYEKQLRPYFDVKVYDTCELAGIDVENLSKEDIHNAFVSYGIDKAVDSLINLEFEKINLLAFSIGGFIAWETSLKGVNVNIFYAISSTRLRIQKSKPLCNLQLYFGENDVNIPDIHWFNSLDIIPNIIINKDHNLYKEDIFIDELCTQIINKIHE